MYRRVLSWIAILLLLPILPVVVASATFPADRSTMSFAALAVWTVALVAGPLGAVGLAWHAGRTVPERRLRVASGAGIGAVGMGFGPLIGAAAVLSWTEIPDRWLGSAIDAFPTLLLLGALLGGVLALLPTSAEGSALDL